MNTLGANYTIVDTEQKFGLLDTYYDKNSEAEFVYVKASGTIAAFDAVKIDHDGTAAALTTTISGAEPTRVGVSQVALSANQFGWVFVRGGGTSKGIKVNALTLCNADAKLYTTATPGAIDDATTDLIQGLVLVAANPSGGTVATECHAVTYLVTNCQD